MTRPDLRVTLDAIEQDSGRVAGMLFVDIAASYFASTGNSEGAVSTRRTPADLAERFSEPLPLEGKALADVALRMERDVVSDANHLMHPMYLGHQVSAPLPAAVWADVVTSALNNSLAVWEMSPTGTSVEGQVIRWMCDLAGLGPGSGGTLTSGGTEATVTGLLAARAALMPDAWDRGVAGPLPVIICGEHTHYGATRAAAEIGIGLRNVIAIPSRDGKMDPVALERRLDALRVADRKVLAVVATSGCTATGAFDDLERIGELCESRGLWLHVDGAHGASALLSVKHRHRMRGVQRAHTVVWDPHKMMLLPLSTGMLLARNEDHLTGAYAQHAPYLFRGAAEERSIDQGTRSFMCSRRADAFKVWVALQRYGVLGIGALYDHLSEMAMALHGMIGERRDFEVLHVPECNILCFRFLGTGGWEEPRLDAFNVALRERYNRSGRGWITGTTLDGKRVLRVTVMNPRTTERHLDEMLRGLADEAGSMLEDGGR